MIRTWHLVKREDVEAYFEALQYAQISKAAHT